MTEHETSTPTGEQSTSPVTLALAWAVVGIPLLYGLWQTLVKAFQLLSG